MQKELQLLEAKIRIYNIIIDIQKNNWELYVQAKPYLESEMTKINIELSKIEK